MQDEFEDIGMRVFGDGGKLLEILKEHYNVPDAVIGFDLSCSLHEPVTVTWHTYLTEK